MRSARYDLLTGELCVGFHDILVSLGTSLLLFLKSLLRVFADIGFKIAEPEGQAVDEVFEKDRNTMHKLGEAWSWVNQLDFKKGIRESVDFALVDVLEGIFHLALVNVEAVPLVRITARTAAIERIFSDKCHIGINGNTDAVVSRLLEGRADIVGPQNRAEILAATLCVDCLLLNKDFRSGGQLSIPAKTQRGCFRLAVNLFSVKLELFVVEVKGGDRWRIATVKLLGGLFAVDEGRQMSQDDCLDLDVAFTIVRLALRLKI
ncbi:hypothetical protein HG531_013818 [Fusarium graminearum]|nr:hypothetical protein HG531_013818 [Fusarium graminearum]